MTGGPGVPKRRFGAIAGDVDAAVEHDGDIERSLLEPGLRGLAVPAIGRRGILRHAAAEIVQQAQIQCRFGVAGRGAL